MSDHIEYREGYKYQLAKEFSIDVPILPKKDIHTHFISLTRNGKLTLQPGYAWDGASGAKDTKNFMRGSLVHDALYQLLREGRIPHHEREVADRLLKLMCLTDGMSYIRSEWVYRAVVLLGKSAANACSKKPILTAP